MQDWNVVVTLNRDSFRRACEFLGGFGHVQATSYFNVLTLHVPDPGAFPGELERALAERPAMRGQIARAVPVTRTFDFQSPEAFEAGAVAAVEPWLPRFAGSRFHARMHRRGFRGRLASPEEERFLDRHIIGRLQQQGSDAQVSFDDPDLVLAVETVDQRAGLSLWTREDL